MGDFEEEEVEDESGSIAESLIKDWVLDST